jgi:hypothetical protein
MTHAKESWKSHFSGPIYKVSNPDEFRKLLIDLDAPGISVLNPPVGPYRQALQPFLQNQRDIQKLQREWDIKLMPFGKKGFFDFWKTARILFEDQLLSADTRLCESP